MSPSETIEAAKKLRKIFYKDLDELSIYKLYIFI